MEAHAVPAPRVAARRGPVRHSLLSDERLARLVSSGDEQAFATLYERYHQPLYRYCRSMLRHDADAQDALQSAMTGAYAALQRSQRDAPVRPWLFRIAHNESVSVLRRRRPTVELTDDLGATAASVEEHEGYRARLAQLLADLKELPERQRSALVMRELSGLTHEDIAIALGTSLGAAKQTIFEARRALAEFQDGRAMRCEEICRLVSDADGRVLRARRVRAHMRDCSSCRAFASTIPARSADLRALAPPLPAIAAAGVLTRVLGGSSVGGGSAGAVGGAGVIGSMAGKGVTLGLVSKAVAGLAIVSAASVGITTAVDHSQAIRHPTVPARSTHSASLAAAHRPGRSTTGSVTKTTPAGAHTTGRSTHAALFATHGKSAAAPSAAVERGVVTPPGQTVSSTISSGVGHGNGASNSGVGSGNTNSNSGVGHGGTTSATKSQQGQTHSSKGSNSPSTTTAHHQNPSAASSSKPLTVPVHIPHLLG
jgi:RNA polymerase sigma factor (sigma-70 family)